MTREEVKRLIQRFRNVDGAAYDSALNAVEKAIDELINEEVRGRTFGSQPRERNDLAARFLAILIEKHDGRSLREGGPFDRAIAGRAVAYADDLIRTLRERKAP